MVSAVNEVIFKYPLYAEILTQQTGCSLSLEGPSFSPVVHSLWLALPPHLHSFGLDPVSAHVNLQIP